MFFFLISLEVSAQSTLHKYFIGFTDKNGSSYSTSNPSAFLSNRAIERRAMQNIPVISQDFPVNTNYIDSVLSKGAILFARNKWFNGITVACDSSTLSEILLLPFVKSTQKVFKYSSTNSEKNGTNVIPISTPSMLKSEWNDYGNSFNQIHLMNGEFLHQAGNRGEGMLMAIIDDGFRSVDQLNIFQHLREQNHIVATWDFVSNDAFVYEDDIHGMEVLSTIAGYEPGKLIGTAPNASFLLLRSEDVNTENIIEEYNWDAAAEFADSAGADVISSSLGYTTFNDTSLSHSYSDMDGNHCPSSIAADIAVSKGILVLTSAGNEGNKAWHYISAPSDGDSVLCIGGVDSNGNHAFFSSYGPASDGAVKPNVVAKAFQATFVNELDEVTTGNGTSFACPILAGSATCLWQRYPMNTVMEVKNAIEKSASIYNMPNNALGYGIPDFRIAAYLLSQENLNITFENNILGVYPSPFIDEIHVRFYSSVLEDITVEVFNSLGQLVYTSVATVKGGFINTIDINFDNNNKCGIYFLKITVGSQRYEKVVLKMQ